MARDPLRRRASRDAQNARRRAERALKSVQAQIKKLTGRDRADTLTMRDLKLHAEAMQSYIKNASTRGKTVEEVYESIADLDERVAATRDYVVPNIAFREEVAAAQRGFKTLTFGASGKEATLMTKVFFIATKPSWISAPTPEMRYGSILKRAGYTRLADVWADIKSKRELWDFLADFIEVAQSGDVDTRSDTFQEFVISKYAELPSPEAELNKAISAYLMSYGSIF